MPRLFIAIELPADARQELSTVQQRLAQRAPGFRWADAGQMHLTLLFLGETPETRLDDVYRTMDAAATGTPMLELGLDGIGVFGRPSAPRVIWVGIAGPPALLALQQRLTEDCAACGLTSEHRPFAPHLTIARARRDHSGRLASCFADGITPAACRFHAHEIVLFESQLGRAGAVHRSRHSSPLSVTEQRARHQSRSE